jgi:hypothetical protein
MASGGQEAFPEGASVRGLGQIEYRLARDSAVREFRRGRRSRLDICDAQPELMRVAQNLGRWTETDCPICEDAKLVNVAFAFGPGLPPSGRALSSEDELRSLAKTKDDASFYVVEVCIKCSWNHLLRMFSSAAVRKGIPGRSR